MDITAGLAKLRTQINKLERRIHNLDMSEVDPKELHAAIESLNALKARYKEMEEAHTKKKQEKESVAPTAPATPMPQHPVMERENLPEVVSEEKKPEAPKGIMHPSFQPPREDRPSLMRFPRRPQRKLPKHHVVDVPAPTTQPQEKQSDVNKFAIHDVVEPVRGTPGSRGSVMGHDEANDMVYVAWNAGALKDSHGYGAYSAKDLKKVAAEKHASLNKQAGPGAGREFKVKKNDSTSGSFIYNLQTGKVTWKEMPTILAFDLLGYYDGITDADGRLVKVADVQIGWWQNGQANVKYDLATAMKEWQKESPMVFRDSTGDIEVGVEFRDLESMIGGGYMRTVLKPGDTFQACGDGALTTNYEMYETSFCVTIQCQEEFDYLEQDVFDLDIPEKDEEGNDVDPGDYADMMRDNYKYNRPRAKSSQDNDLEKTAASNEAVVESFVNRINPDIKSGNLYIRVREDGWDLINYQTVIARNLGDKVLLDNRRYSTTTSKIQGLIGFKASQAGLQVLDMQTGKPEKPQPREHAEYNKLPANSPYERVSAQADEELEEPEQTEDEPSDDDIFIQDSGHLGAGTVAFQGGKQIAELHDDWDQFYQEIRSWMEQHKYFPNVWQISDHGNAHLVTDIYEGAKTAAIDTDGNPDANDVVETYINGNISDAREWLKQDPDLFPEALAMMKEYNPRDAQRFVELCYPYKKQGSLDKTAHVVEEGGKWYVYNHDKTKKLSKGYGSKQQAVKRLRQIEYFKHQGSLNIQATSWHVLGNGDLEITLDPETAKRMDVNPETLDSDDAMYELFEPVTANGLSWVAPEQIGALTDAPILSDSPSLDDGSADPEANYWWYPNYAVESPARELVEKGRVIFKKASSIDKNAGKYTGDMDKDLKVLLPHIVADGVAGQDRDLSDWLVERARQIYKHNPEWGKKVARENDAARDFLAQFMAHWLKAKEANPNLSNEASQITAADSTMETKCEECGKELGPEAFLSKWPVCGACTKKRHKKVTQGSEKVAENKIPLNVFDGGFYAVETSNDPSVPHGYAIFNGQGQQVMVITTQQPVTQERLESIVHDEYGKRELVRATLTTDHEAFKKGTTFVVSGINRTKKQLRVRANKEHIWIPLEKVAETVNLEQHIEQMKTRMNNTKEQLQQQVVTTEATVDVEADDPMPDTPLSDPNEKWTWDAIKRKWFITKLQ